MSRTPTSSHPSFHRSNVSYYFASPNSTSTTVTIHIPPGSNWTTGLHWHSTHTEFLKIVKGKALVTLGTSTRIYSAGDGDGDGDGVIRVDKGVVHEWRRVPVSFPKRRGVGQREEAEGEEEEEELVVQEWTDPPDGQKEVFFRNLNSVILDAEKTVPHERIPMEWWIEWQILVIGAGLDNYPVVVTRDNRGMISMLTTHIVLTLLSWSGWIFGLKAWYAEYTPSRLIAKEKTRAMKQA